MNTKTLATIFAAAREEIARASPEEKAKASLHVITKLDLLAANLRNQPQHLISWSKLFCFGAFLRLKNGDAQSVAGDFAPLVVKDGPLNANAKAHIIYAMALLATGRRRNARSWLWSAWKNPSVKSFLVEATYKELMGHAKRKKPGNYTASSQARAVRLLQAAMALPDQVHGTERASLKESAPHVVLQIKEQRVAVAVRDTEADDKFADFKSSSRAPATNLPRFVPHLSVR
jgi:hypothetical protein